MKTNKINFKKPKYYMPPVFYLISLFLGYIVIDTSNIELGEAGNGNLKTTDYLSSALPDAKTDSLLGSKMDNTERKYGKITDLSGLASVESDRDSVNKRKNMGLNTIRKRQHLSDSRRLNRRNSRSCALCKAV